MTNNIGCDSSKRKLRSVFGSFIGGVSFNIVFLWMPISEEKDSFIFYWCLPLFLLERVGYILPLMANKFNPYKQLLFLRKTKIYSYLEDLKESRNRETLLWKKNWEELDMGMQNVFKNSAFFHDNSKNIPNIELSV